MRRTRMVLVVFLLGSIAASITADAASQGGRDPREQPKQKSIIRRLIELLDNGLGIPPGKPADPRP